jgi:soluble cytochrome b562
MRRTLLLFAVIGLLAAGCGGSASTDTLGTSGTVGATVNTGAAAQSLRSIAARAQAVITTKIQQLATTTSSADVAARLGEARTQIEDLAQQTENVETDDANLAQARDRLHDALDALADQIGDAQSSVQSGDTQQAIQDLLSSSVVTDLRQAIQGVMNQSG